MSYQFSVEQFEGPLDLLLKLIEDEKLDITTISLAKVTDQYLAYIAHEEVLPPDEIADFLVVAAKLIYMKSKYLLPALQLDDEDGQDLEQQLKIYREYFQASKVISKMIGRKKFSYMRTQPLKQVRTQGFYPPQGLTVRHMADSLIHVIGRLDIIARLPKIILKTTVSIREKIQALTKALERGILEFHRFYDSGNKQDVIVSFLALLELVKLRHVQVEQSAIFSKIIISRKETV